MTDLLEAFAARFNYFLYIALILTGLYAMIVRRNLMRKVIGMGIFQTGIILFFISTGAKWGATIPIEIKAQPPPDYMNPLPHALMLTAIVVAVATLGVALAIAICIHREFGTLDEEAIR
jgi:multicomponent Na+:H+ antiporter subunit C